MTPPTTPPPGISWQQARSMAAARLDWLAAQWRAAGIDLEQLEGQAGPVATYHTARDFAELRPEEPPEAFQAHPVIVRAAIQEARRRWGLRLVPIDLPAKKYQAWLAGADDTPAARGAYLAERFAALSADL